MERVHSLVDHIEVMAGEVLAHEGHPAPRSFVIVEGEASMVLRDRALARLGPGEFFGELALLSPGLPAAATVTAITPMRLLVLERRDIAALAEIPCAARWLLQTVMARLPELPEPCCCG